MDRMSPEAFARWRDALGVKLTCAACGGKDFSIRGVVGAPVFRDGLAITPYEFATFQPVTCDHCGLAMLFFAMPSPPAGG